MNADERGYKHQVLTRKVIGIFFAVYNELGFGFLESVYRRAMWMALRDAGLEVLLEFPIVVHFRGRTVGKFQPDLVVNGAVLVELKAVRRLIAAHKAQTLNYLRASVLEVALLLNFGPKPQAKRLAFSNHRKHGLPPSNLRSSALICG